MKQRATRSISEIKAKIFENEKMAAFLYGLTEGDTLYSPLFGYLNVKKQMLRALRWAYLILTRMKHTTFFFVAMGV